MAEATLFNKLKEVISENDYSLDPHVMWVIIQ
jgi:hypothetical protein